MLSVRRTAGLLLSAVLLVASGCSVSVSSVNPDQEARYDSVWAADWGKVAADQRSLQPSGSSPGVCNVGGSKQGCYDTDNSLIVDFHVITQGLSHIAVPAEFKQGNSAILRGIATLIRGLSDRNTAIVSNNTKASMDQSNQELQAGYKTLETAVPQFKGPKPPPNPFRLQG